MSVENRPKATIQTKSGIEEFRQKRSGPRSNPTFLLATWLEMAVPLEIARFELIGGPRDWHLVYEFIQKVGNELAEKGDILQYGGGKKGEVAGIVARLGTTIAMLAFQPGGITFLGTKWVAGSENSEVSSPMPSSEKSAPKKSRRNRQKEDVWIKKTSEVVENIQLSLFSEKEI